MSSNTAAPSAQSAWISRFDGPIVRREVTFGSPLVRHQFRRSFEHVGRNVHMVSVFGRVLLGEEKITEAEAAIYRRIDEIMKALGRKVASSEVVVKEAGHNEDMATYNKPQTHMADIVVPAQTKFLQLLMFADKYAQNFFTLWLHGEIDDKEKSKLEFELKKLLRTIPATTRKMREFIQAKLNESEHEEAKREAAAMVADAKDDEEVDEDSAKIAAAVLAGEEAKPKKAAAAKPAKVRANPGVPEVAAAEIPALAAAA